MPFSYRLQIPRPNLGEARLNFLLRSKRRNRQSRRRSREQQKHSRILRRNLVPDHQVLQRPRHHRRAVRGRPLRRRLRRLHQRESRHAPPARRQPGPQGRHHRGAGRRLATVPLQVRYLGRRRGARSRQGSGRRPQGQHGRVLRESAGQGRGRGGVSAEGADAAAGDPEEGRPESGEGRRFDASEQYSGQLVVQG